MAESEWAQEISGAREGEFDGPWVVVIRWFFWIHVVLDFTFEMGVCALCRDSKIVAISDEVFPNYRS